MADWEIKKPSGRCAGSGEPIPVGQEFYAALVETEQGLQRQDFSVQYWQTHQPAVYCYWKTRMPEPNQKKRLLVDEQMLMAFFDRLAEETEPQKVQFRFVLMLILMRKRRLKYESSRINANGQEVWTLRVVGQDRTAEVINPHLSDEQIQNLSEQMSQILQVDL